MARRKMSMLLKITSVHGNRIVKIIDINELVIIF